jgi:predicted ester cyclase
VAAVDALFSPDLVAHRSGRPALSGLARMRDSARLLPALYGDSRCVIDDLIAEGDRVVARWRITGTHERDLLGIAATGRPLSFTGITIHRVVDGKIAEMWAEEDWLGVVRQLGVGATPPPPGEGAAGTEAVLRRLVEGVWRGDTALVEELVALPYLAGNLKGLAARFQAAISEAACRVEETVAAGERVAMRVTLEGVHTGDFRHPLGLGPATGHRVAVTGIVIGRVAQGRLVEFQQGWGTLGLLQQLGVLAPPVPGG